YRPGLGPERLTEEHPELAEPGRAAPPATVSEPGRARARRREAGAEIGAGADGCHRPREVHDRTRLDLDGLGLHLLRDEDRLRRPGDHQLLHLLVAFGILRSDQIREVLDRADLAPFLLAQPHTATGPDAHPRPHPESEAAADAGDVEVDHQPQYEMRERRDA